MLLRSKIPGYSAAYIFNKRESYHLEGKKQSCFITFIKNIIKNFRCSLLIQTHMLLMQSYTVFFIRAYSYHRPK
jgi:hypothetical protein